STSSAGSGGSRGGSSSNSASTLLSTLIPVALQAAVFVGLFLFFRPKLQRVYQPRTYLESLRDDEKSRELPTGRFNWIKPFRQVPDEYVLNHGSLDGYLYMRFFKMLTIISFIGCCVTWPVLFPVNATGGGGKKQLDLLSFANITKAGKNRYYAHVFIGWIFFSIVMYIITRETIYFINLRHAYLLAPFNAAKISSRTVLFTDVPTEYMNQEKLLALFGTSMRRAWLATDCKDLTEKVEERDKDAFKLEGAEIKLSQTANKRRLKWEKKNDKRKDEPAADAEAALPGSKYQKPGDRPTHRLGKIPLIGKKVDTINWTRDELRRLHPEVQEDQLAHQQRDAKVLNATFVEFTTQKAAETAYRRMSPRKAPRMNPRAISATPNEIVWSNLRIKKTERTGRKFACNSFLTLMILFWAIPVAVVGSISNINALTDKVHFLSFIDNCPTVILGLITGLLPVILLSVLMALVPIVCRWMAKLKGEVTLPDVELSTQNWYMAFQVVQVFLVSTFASGAAAVVTQIIDKPSSATTLLAQNLPLASNYFIAYFILQGLGIAAGNLLNIGALVVMTVVAKFLDKSPRKMFKRYMTLGGLGWGSLYPKFGNMGIIAITYSIISPLLLGFATIGFALIYLAVRYNAFFVLSNNIDTKGRAYALVLQQLMVGVYLGEICLIGLFAINTAPGPIVLMAIFLAFTAIYHAALNHALNPLKEYLPDSLDGDDQLAMFTTTDHKSYDSSKQGVPPSEAETTAPKKFHAKKADFLGRIFDPRKFKSHQAVKSLVPDWLPPQYEDKDEELAYFNPAITSPMPELWIVRDEMGISAREVKDSSEVVGITDDLARFDEKNKVVWDREHPADAPIWEKKIDY
ncbi:putative membrane protein, partial [Lachnellula hyalina]